MPNNLERVDALARNDLLSFTRKAFETVNSGKVLLDNWHLHLLSSALQQCASGEIKRLIINLPPRSLKSMLASISFPAWLLGHDPTIRIICASYADSLARAHSRDCRRVMETDWYSRVFPAFRFDPRKNTEHEIVTSENGHRLATSVGGTLTGRGGDVIIVDDPIKTGDAASEAERMGVNEWYSNTLYTRLDDKNKGVIIIVMQRAHTDDLVGHVLRKDDWTVISLPAIAQQSEEFEWGETGYYRREIGDALHPEREDLETLELIKENIGSYNFAAQYLQQPVPPEGIMIHREWFRRYQNRPDRDRFRLIVQSWDTANSAGEANSYSVCTTWGVLENRYYLLDVVRDRMEFPTLEQFVRKHARVWGSDHILIEKAASGLALLQLLDRNTKLPLIPVLVSGDKVTRIAQVSGLIESGRVYLPEDAPWLATFEHEVLSFPHGRFDDQVDSLAHFLRWVIFHERRVPEVRVYPIGTRSGGDRYFDRTGIPIWHAHM